MGAHAFTLLVRIFVRAHVRTEIQSDRTAASCHRHLRLLFLLLRLLQARKHAERLRQAEAQVERFDKGSFSVDLQVVKSHAAMPPQRAPCWMPLLLAQPWSFAVSGASTLPASTWGKRIVWRQRFSTTASLPHGALHKGNGDRDSILCSDGSCRNRFT